VEHATEIALDQVAQDKWVFHGNLAPLALPATPGTHPKKLVKFCWLLIGSSQRAASRLRLQMLRLVLELLRLETSSFCSPIFLN
jgi:hypothetical protein